MDLTLPRLPAGLVRVGQRIPGPILSLHAALGLELARKHLWLTPPAKLDGRSFAITVNDLGLRFAFSCEAGRFRAHLPPRVDLEIRASAADFLSLLRGSTDADTLFFQRRLQIAGDTELGLIVKNWLDAAERPAWLGGQVGQLM